MYGNAVATTYCFSTVGGGTENIENSWPGTAPVAYLKSVDDPYDNVSPRHRWRFVWSRKQLDHKLGSWVQGKLRGVKVTQRGVSPRIVAAQVVGTRGVTDVTGPDLRTRLGLYDTWAYFIAIKSGQRQPPPPTTTPGGGVADGGQTAASAAVALVVRLLHLERPRQLVLSGSISPRPKHVTVQHLVRGQWKPLGRGRTDRLGRYAMLMPRAGLYRVLANGAVGPTTRIR